MATHSSVLAWRTPGTGELGGPSSMGSHRVGHDWSNLAEHSTCNRDFHCRQVHRQHVGCSWVLCLWSAHRSLHLLMSWEPTWSPLSLALLPSGERVPAGRRKNAHLKGTKPTWTQPSGLLLHQHESNLTPSTAVIANEWRRKSHLVLASGISSSISSYTSKEGDSCQHTLGKNETTFSPKATGTWRLYRDTSTEGHPFQTAVDNCFT